MLRDMAISSTSPQRSPRRRYLLWGSLAVIVVLVLALAAAADIGALRPALIGLQ